MYNINVYENLKHGKIIDTIDVKDWFERIKTLETKYRNLVSSAREEGKYDEDGRINKLYEGIKLLLPCITCNFTFNKYKNDSNIINSTGLLFIDIDNDSFDINILDKSKVFTYYHSLDGKGYHLIVKVNNLNLDNFKETYLYICNDLGILNFIDRNCIRKTQYSIISFDKDIFINDDCFVYDSLNNIFLKKDNNKKVQYNIIKEEEIGNGEPFLKSDSFIKLKFKTELDEYPENCVLIKEGKEYVECFIPFSIYKNRRVLVEGQKHKVLTCYINNLIYLNPTVPREQLIATLKAIVGRMHNLMIPNANLIAIVDNKLKQQREGTLLPIRAKLKYYWVDPKCDNKKTEYLKKQGNVSITLIDKFFDRINDIDVKITIDLIIEKTGLCRSTVKRKLTDEMKEIIKKHNKNLKNEKRIHTNKGIVSE